ncbi:MAG TPA: LytR C-terminal domain-containing protein [Syntrophales bacterium]|nr:LytR C-terminal domain-containing protein [Syntrophales bacterium]
MRTLCIFVLMVCLASSGCSALDFSGRNTTEELQRSKASIAQLNEQMAAVNKELASLKSEVQKMKGAEAVTKDSSVTGEMGKKEQVKEVDISKRDEMKKPTDEKKSMEGTEASLKDLKVKVLSGNGKLPTAKQMSKRLVVMGYRVADIGIAVRADYKVNTIYYAPDYRAEAQRLAVQLGGKTIAKPLTWTSFFHIIVVAAP